jgi:hypothetical protein
MQCGCGRHRNQLLRHVREVLVYDVCVRVSAYIYIHIICVCVCVYHKHTLTHSHNSHTPLHGFFRAGRQRQHTNLLLAARGVVDDTGAVQHGVDLGRGDVGRVPGETLRGGGRGSGRSGGGRGRGLGGSRRGRGLVGSRRGGRGGVGSRRGGRGRVGSRRGGRVGSGGRWRVGSAIHHCVHAREYCACVLGHAQRRHGAGGARAGHGERHRRERIRTAREDCGGGHDRENRLAHGMCLLPVMSYVLLDGRWPLVC